MYVGIKCNSLVFNATPTREPTKSKTVYASIVCRSFEPLAEDLEMLVYISDPFSGRLEPWTSLHPFMNHNRCLQFSLSIKRTNPNCPTCLFYLSLFVSRNTFAQVRVKGNVTLISTLKNCRGNASESSSVTMHQWKSKVAKYYDH